MRSFRLFIVMPPAFITRIRQDAFVRQESGKKRIFKKLIAEHADGTGF